MSIYSKNRISAFLEENIDNTKHSSSENSDQAKLIVPKTATNAQPETLKPMKNNPNETDSAGRAIVQGDNKVKESAKVTPAQKVQSTDNNRKPNPDDRKPKLMDKEDREWLKKQKENNTGKDFDTVFKNNL